MVANHTADLVAKETETKHNTWSLTRHLDACHFGLSSSQTHEIALGPRYIHMNMGNVNYTLRVINVTPN